MQKKKVITFAAAAVLLLGILWGGLMVFLDGNIMNLNENYVDVGGQQLNSYSRSSGGGMQGGYHRTSIRRYDDTYALLCSESTDWHSQYPDVSECFVDIKVLDAIQAIFSKYTIQDWNHKKFTDMFIADGASYSYHFGFDAADVYFSSQHYPKEYSDKLMQLSEAIAAYTKDMKSPPGLVVLDTKRRRDYIPRKGEFCLYVYNYMQNRLHYRIINDTNENVTYTLKPVIKNAKDNSVVYTVTKQARPTAHPHDVRQDEIKLKERLPSGTYVLHIDGYSCTFEIRENPNQ